MDLQALAPSQQFQDKEAGTKQAWPMLEEMWQGKAENGKPGPGTAPTRQPGLRGGHLQHTFVDTILVTAVLDRMGSPVATNMPAHKLAVHVSPPGFGNEGLTSEYTSVRELAT